MEIDIFNHVMPQGYLELIKSHLLGYRASRRRPGARTTQIVSSVAGQPRRLHWRAEIEVRDLAGARLAVRVERRNDPIVFSGLRRRLPRMRIITHHRGGGMIPYFAGTSDCPFDLEGGPMLIREGVRSIENLNLAEDDERKICFGNAP